MKRERLGRGLTLGEIAERSRISERYLLAIEEERFEDIPGEVYLRNFLRIYAEILSLDPEEILRGYESRQVFKGPCLPLTLKGKPFRPTLTPRVLGRILTSLLVGLVLFWLISGLVGLKRAPNLVVVTPGDNLVTEAHRIVVKGWVDKGATLTINGDMVNILDSSGTFEEEVPLKIGLNFIKISAKKTHGREKTLVRKVMVVEKADTVSRIDYPKY